MYYNQFFFFLSRLQICSYLFCELLKIAFYLHCSVGGPLHHYLLPADDRMIGFLLGFSLVFLTKSWIYSSNYYYFFSESSDFSALIWFRDLRWDSSHLLLEEYASAHRLRHLFLVFFFFLCVCRCLQAKYLILPGKWRSRLHSCWSLQRDGTHKSLLLSLSELTEDIVGITGSPQTPHWQP